MADSGKHASSVIGGEFRTLGPDERSEDGREFEGGGLAMRRGPGFRKARVKRDGRWFQAVASPNVVRKGGGLEEGGATNQKNEDLQATAVPLGCFKSMAGAVFS